MEIGGETSEEGKTDLEMGTGDMPFIGLRVVILSSRTTRGTLLKRWER